MNRFSNAWVTAEDDLWDIADALDTVPHFPFFPPENAKYIRKADAMERKAGVLKEWSKKDRGT
jgi:hypothetical protein